MPKRGSPTPGPPPPAGPEPERDGAGRFAIAAILHRLNGGLNNAALAFELSRRNSADTDAERTLARGIAGVEQASRAATLLAWIIDPATTRPVSAIGPYADDVVDILRGHARRIGATVDAAVSAIPETCTTPAATAEALLSGFIALERASTLSSPSKQSPPERQ